MNIRTLAFCLVCLCGFQLNSAPSEQAAQTQNKELIAFLQQMPEEELRKLVDDQFENDLAQAGVGVSCKANGFILSLVVAYLINPSDYMSFSYAKKAFFGLVCLWGVNEALGLLGGMARFVQKAAEREREFKNLLEMRAGAEMRDAARARK